MVMEINGVKVSVYRTEIPENAKMIIFEFIDWLENNADRFGFDTIEKIHFSRTGNTKRTKTTVRVNDKIRFRNKNGGVEVAKYNPETKKWIVVDVVEDEKLKEFMSKFDEFRTRTKDGVLEAKTKDVGVKEYLKDEEGFLKYLENLKVGGDVYEFADKLTDIIDEAYSEGIIADYDIRKNEEKQILVQVKLKNGEVKEFAYGS